MFTSSLTQPLRNVQRALFRAFRGITRAASVPRQPLPCRSLSLRPRRAQSKPVSSLVLRLESRSTGFWRDCGRPHVKMATKLRVLK